MSQHQKRVKELKTDNRDGKEVDGNQLGDVILEEGGPGLREWLAAPYGAEVRRFAGVRIRFPIAVRDVNGRSPAGSTREISIAEQGFVRSVIRAGSALSPLSSGTVAKYSRLPRAQQLSWFIQQARRVGNTDASS